VQVNNVFNNPQQLGQQRWVAFERPQLVFQYYSGRTGDLLYAEAISSPFATEPREPYHNERRRAERGSAKKLDSPD
jgi:hypothetical protein